MKKPAGSLIRALAAALVLLPLLGRAEDEDSARPGQKAREDSKIDHFEIDARTEAAIDRGLKWLSERQNQDGSFGDAEYPVAFTALSGLAFLAAGSVPDRGRYARNVKAAQEYILGRQIVSGLISDKQLYSHGFATLFLAEIYGMEMSGREREKVRRALAQAVNLLERVQLSSGGWWYNPEPLDNSDISVTICQVMALRAARNAGISVSPEVVRKAAQCVKKAYFPDTGGFAYRVFADGRLPTGGHAFPRTAAGVCILYYLGEYDTPEVKGGLQYLLARKPGPGIGNRKDPYYKYFYYYGMYYATQAMYQAGGRQWEEWYPAVRDDLLSKQIPGTGAFSGASTYVGDDLYATAMALITLQIPNRYLPILQR